MPQEPEASHSRSNVRARPRTAITRRMRPWSRRRRWSQPALARRLARALNGDVAPRCCGAHCSLPAPASSTSRSRRARWRSPLLRRRAGRCVGKGSAKEGKRVMVEHTQPNPFKEMHIGHLMSNTIGEATARLIENEGAKVVRANYRATSGRSGEGALGPAQGGRH